MYKESIFSTISLIYQKFHMSYYKIACLFFAESKVQREYDYLLFDGNSKQEDVFMGRKLRGIMAGVLGIGMLMGSMGAAGAASESGDKDYEGHWAQKTIETWLEKGDLKGFQDGSVKPNQPITRAEFMALVNRSFGFTAESKISFTDVAPANWAYSEVAKAVAAGYIQGYDNRIRPGDPINRQEAAVVAAKLLGLVEGNINELQAFSDAGSIAQWGKASVAAAIKAGILKGYPNGTFAPAQALTRAESLTLIDNAASRLPAVQPSTAPAASAAASPSPSPTVTATPVAAAGGGGGGGGGNPAPVDPTATPASTATSAPTATPASTATPVPTMPVVDIPLLDIKVDTAPNASVTNAVYLQFDYSALPESQLGNGGYASYYVTATPLTSRDLYWGMKNRKAAIPLQPAYSYYSNPHVGINIPSEFVPVEGEYYVTVLLIKLDKIVGYYTQKVRLQPTLVTSSGNLARLEGGVSIRQEKQHFDITVNGGDHYTDVIDVTDAMENQPGGAVYYTISPKYRFNSESKLTVDNYLKGSLNLYTDKTMRIIDTGYPYRASADDIPLALVNFDIAKFYNEQEYTIIFYNKDLQALSYYQGKVQLSDELAVEAAIKRIDAIQSNRTALEEENNILRAERAYSLLGDSLKAQVGQNRAITLENALAQLEIMKGSGPLGNSLPLTAVKIFMQNRTMNGPTLTAYSADLAAGAESLSFYITDAPVTAADLNAPSIYGMLKYLGYESLPVAGLQGTHYVTVVLYDKNNQPIKYATQSITASYETPVWDGSAVAVNEGVTLERVYNNGSLVDYVNYGDYIKSHPEAVYVTATSGAALGKDQSFSPAAAVKLLNIFDSTRSYPFSQMSLVDNVPPAGYSEDYIVIFYDKDFKVISYYIGTLAD